ncbi:GFA family protein [Roseovarius sp. SCSIO 43702]|uniref:GFA family protein n=1 Tax=Roseovarius sp. SCSIO 43702 TaxID=2823043 RepID=UPI001C736057|nr:GFA family protein [Roseovarius sp. SCSIO 43702]QYX57927.1 GFA family protein [Roseovarius sp. SCSIO 43702]
MGGKRGSCLCGQVTYRVDGPLREVVACHCTQCRKTSGHYVAATSAAADDLAISGEVTWYRASTTARRGFCATCGSSLFWAPDGEARFSIFAGTLDGATGLRMTSQICTRNKGDYYDLPDVPVGDD